jgi:hypothetical protein
MNSSHFIYDSLHIDGVNIIIFSRRVFYYSTAIFNPRRLSAFLSKQPAVMPTLSFLTS